MTESAAIIGNPTYTGGSRYCAATLKISGITNTRPTAKNSGRPTMNPVSISAHCTRVGPLTCIRLVPMRWAAPLSATIFPSIAPSAMMMASDPNVSPSPFWID